VRYFGFAVREHNLEKVVDFIPGTAVLFLNESAERHHGVIWFEDEGALRP